MFMSFKLTTLLTLSPWTVDITNAKLPKTQRKNEREIGSICKWSLTGFDLDNSLSFIVVSIVCTAAGKIHNLWIWSRVIQQRHLCLFLQVSRAAHWPPASLRLTSSAKQTPVVYMAFHRLSQLCTAVFSASLLISVSLFLPVFYEPLFFCWHSHISMVPL